MANLICISLEYLQLESGHPDFILNQPFPVYSKWINPTWLTIVWQFFFFTKCTITFDHPWLPLITQTNDIFLMPFFLSLDLSPKDLGKLSYCCLSLQVITLANISNGDGTLIDLQSKQGICNIHRASSLKWPYQERPTNTDGKLWKIILSHLETNDRLL